MAKLGDMIDRADLSAVGKTSSEATKIEQTRAFAEVVVQAKMAKEFPRNIQDVFRRITEAFENSPALLAASKYAYPRGGEEISGYSIDFARCIAECVGNIHYSIKELSRDDDQSEILAYAWDLETNTMQTRSIVVPHTRDTKQGKKTLVDDRDIYENNTNNGARRLRECILGVIPTVAVKFAEDTVERLLANAFPPEKIAKFSAELVKKFDEMGVTKAMLIAERGGRGSVEWTKEDLAALNSHGRAIKAGTKTIVEIFGAPPAKKGNTPTEVAAKVETKPEPAKPNPELQKPAGNQPADGALF